ncbi:hypothetical protein ABL78_7719 [Leptomonas seymouri]|uniref:Guanine nucleotide-binding protein subunit beta-like protein n=1 Tax=Leptomonas seymouri TaxID=5684 RepID=A0A0N1HZ49_LEPSE|nr:hypothetical protein ABL78_7719 [Leptomonas seymouri]|eukprot:KPI83250.1 hypothetical protein ABL78_7719 [Leptomonas seymouri]
MSKDCDVFSDSYGCIITKCSGYQSPFPIVRLSNGEAVLDEDRVTLQGACFASSLIDPNAARGRLLTFDLPARDGCVSFLQLISRSRKPLELDQKTEFVKKLDMSAASFAAVTRSKGGRWDTSIYLDAGEGDTRPRFSRVLFRCTSSASLLDAALWLVEMATEESDTRQLYYYRVDDAVSGAPPSTFQVGEALKRPLDVVALTADTAVVLGTGGWAAADRREAVVHAVVTTPISNACVAGDNMVVAFGEDYVLRVFDMRKAAVPVLETSTSSYVCVKSAVGCAAALLVTGDVTGVLDLQTLTAVVSLQHSGDQVLDATLLPHKPGGFRVCTSTESGMIYDWAVAT